MSTKSNLLSLLEQHRGTYLSGQELAERLQISRAAVCKAIRTLKKQGHQIASVTNKGYCLSDENDVLSEEGILQHLASAPTQLFVYKTVDSTNQVAKKMALDQAPHGAIVLAEEQTAGRGRMGRPFYSPPSSGIYMSFVLRPNLTGSDSVLITTAAAVAVCRAIEQVTGLQPGIKWVNDLYLNGKKICGILTEAITDFETGGIEALILGIGINFSANPTFPIELQQKADALFEKKPAGVTRNQIAAAVIANVLALCQNLQNRSFIKEYRQRSIILGKQIQVLQGGHTQPATALDIDENGGLIVQYANSTTTLNSGEISIRGDFLS